MKTHRIKFIRRGIEFALIFIMLLSAYFILCYNFINSPNQLIWEKESCDIKDNIAKNISGKKMIILSGSNSLFGLSAEKLSDELQIKTVNYALHAGFYTYSFEKAKRILNKGDIVLMPLEYEYYWFNEKRFFDAQPLYARYILTYDKEYYSTFSTIKKINYVLVQLQDLIKNIKDSHGASRETYISTTINEFGDETNYGNPSNLSKKRLISIPEGFSLNNYDGPKEIQKFSVWCKENNITLIASFPPTIMQKEYNNEKYRIFFSKLMSFYNESDILILGKPEDFLYNVSLFYDNRYHLNIDGKKIRTDYVISELKKMGLP